LTDLNITLQTASYLIAALSFALTGAYYIMNLRNTRKTQELQVTMQVVSLFSSSAFWDEYNELMEREWSTLEEYQNK
jgi:type IV secretory pathway component VirB8